MRSGRRAWFRHHLLALLLGTPGLFTGAPGLLVAAPPLLLSALLFPAAAQAQSSDANLKALRACGSTSLDGTCFLLNIGTFAATTTSYTVTVPFVKTHVKLRPTVNESNATVGVRKGITGNFASVDSGSLSAAIALDVGENAITVRVTAQDTTTTKDYTVTITRQNLPAPDGFGASPGNAAFDAKWRPVAGANSYKIEWDAATATGFSKTAVATPGTARYKTIQHSSGAPVVNGSAYKVRVSACSGNDGTTGCGAATAAQTITPGTPGLIGSFSIGPGDILNGKNSLVVKWWPVADNGSPVIGYDVHYTTTWNEGGNAEAKFIYFDGTMYGNIWKGDSYGTGGKGDPADGWVKIARFRSGGLDALPHTTTGHRETIVDVEAGVHYRVRIRAVNAAGPGPWKHTGYGILENVRAPNVPSDVRIEPGNGKLTLRWTAPGYWGRWPQGPADPGGYEILWKRSDAGTECPVVGDDRETAACAAYWKPVWKNGSAAVIGPGETSFEFTGMQHGSETVTNGTSYDLRIRSWNKRPGTDGSTDRDRRATPFWYPAKVTGTPTNSPIIPESPASGQQAGDWPLLETCASYLPSNAVSVSEVTGWRDEHPHLAAHVLRWNRVLEALGEDTGTDASPMTVGDSKANENRFTPARWTRVTATLDAVDRCAAAIITAAPGLSETESAPMVILSGPSGPVAEGSAARITVTLSEALEDAVTIPLTVTRDTSEDGDHGTLSGIEIPAGFTSASADISTNQDSDTDDERFIVALGALPDGLQPSSRTSVAVTIKDDDTSGNQESQEPVSSYTVPAELIRTVRGYYEMNRNRPSGGENWFRVLIAFGVESHATLQPFTVAEAEVEVTKWSGWQPVLDALRQLEAAQAPEQHAPPATPAVSISAGQGVTEGQSASFTLSASPAPATPLAVTVNVTQRGDYAGSSTLDQRTVTIAAGEASATFTVATVDDTTDEPDGAVTATLAAATGYTVSSSQGAATVAVADDDLPLPAIQTKRSLGREGTDDAVVFRVKLDRAASHTVTVDYATADGTGTWAGTQPATAGADYTATSGTLSFAPGQTTQTVSVLILDDVVDEGTEYFLLRFTNPQGATLAAGERETQGLIRNDDPLPAAWQIRFGRTVSQQVVDGLQSRFAAKPQPGLQLSVAGEDLTTDTPLAENQQALAKLMGFESVSSQQLVQESSFSFSPSDSGPQLSFWGQGALSSFQGREENLTLDGDVTTALLGAEWTTEHWQAGAALSHSWGSGGYRQDNGTDGNLSSRLTGIFPYGRYALTPRLGIWATAGYGWGNLTLTTEGREYKPNANLTMAAGGIDGLLVDGGPDGLSLTTRADAMTVKTTTDQVSGLASSDANVSRFRLGLEAARPFPMANGASFLSTMTIGIRQDTGDAETGFGMDLGAGISYADPQRGISADLKGRTLISHAAEDFQDKGMTVSFAWDPTPSNRGPSLSMSHSLGAAADGGLDALLNPDVLQVLDADPGSSGQHQWKTRLAYGFPAFNDRLTVTPALGMTFSQDSRTYSLLWALAPYGQPSQSNPWEISLEGERQENSTAASSVKHSLKLRFSLPL